MNSERYELRVDEYRRSGEHECIYLKTFGCICDAIHAASNEYAKLAGEDQCIVRVIDTEVDDEFATVVRIYCLINTSH